VDVNQQNSSHLASNKKVGTEANSSAATLGMAGNPTITESITKSQPMLSESRWAPAAYNTTQSNDFASAFSPTPAPTAPITSEWSTALRDFQDQPIQDLDSTRPSQWGAATTALVVNDQACPSQCSAKVAPIQQSAVRPQLTPTSDGSGYGWDTVCTTRWSRVQTDGNAPLTQATGFGSAPVPPYNICDFDNAPLVQAIRCGSGVSAQNSVTLASVSGHTRIPSQAMSDVEITGGNSLLDIPIGDLSISNKLMDQALTAMPSSLDDSQPAMSIWNAPNAFATNSGGHLQSQAQSTTSNRSFEAGNQALWEAAPHGFSYLNTQNLQLHTTVGNSWPDPNTPPQAQAFAAPFNVAEVNNRIAQELMQADRRAIAPAQTMEILEHVQRPRSADYGPPHLHNALKSADQTMLGHNTENTSLRKEEKLQYLKDSRWAH
jgi:hypothetical protein